VQYVNHAKLLVDHGMTGATGSIYVGLQEYEDMTFVGHLLRPDELFVDVGANVGSYTILAAAVGAKCLSIEPLPAAFDRLRENVHLNRLADRTELWNIGVGEAVGTLEFTSVLDTTNHVATPLELDDDIPRVPVEVLPLDDVLRSRTPLVIKIDVEGYELYVIRGASRALASGRVLAMVVETNRCSERYGVDVDEADDVLVGSYGFQRCRYEPVTRRLSPLDAPNYKGNTIYVSNVEEARRRLSAAPPLHIQGRAI